MPGFLAFGTHRFHHRKRDSSGSRCAATVRLTTNITHVIAGRIVAKAESAADGNAVLRQELLDPLGMKSST